MKKTSPCFQKKGFFNTSLKYLINKNGDIHHRHLLKLEANLALCVYSFSPRLFYFLKNPPYCLTNAGGAITPILWGQEQRVSMFYEKALTMLLKKKRSPQVKRFK